jgi:hypothetical protein
MDNQEVTGASVPDQALVNQARTGLDPTGFDPSREREIRMRAIEEVVGWIEETSFREVQGILAKRKRAREDAALRGQAIRQERAELVRMIRARLSNESGTTIRALREIRDGEFGHRRGIGHYDLMDAAILADRKLIALTATLAWGDGSYNTAGAETAWSATISDKGLRVLEAIDRDSDGSPEGGDACGSVHDSAGLQGIASTVPAHD